MSEQVSYGDVALALVRIDGGTQPRTEIDEAVVKEYADKYAEGVKLPSIVLFYDGASYWLADGFHRYHAQRSLGREKAEALVHDGTRRDAVLFSVGANQEHGLRRTNADKRKSVMTLLEDEEWSKWGNYEIARRCGVSDEMVRGVKASLPKFGSENNSVIYKTKHGTEATMNVSNIGRKTATEEPAFKSREAVAQRRKDIAEMAERGYTSRQIASAVGLDEQTVRTTAKRHEINIHADRIVRGSHRHDSTRIVEQMVMDAENLTADVNLIAFSDLDATQIATWVTSLTASRDKFNAFIRRLKEQQKHGEAA